MRFCRTSILLACILTALSWSLASADHIIWHSPLGMVPADSRLTVGPDIPAEAVRITTTGVGDLQWVVLGLTLPSDVTIDAVTLCYQLSSAQSYISQVRLTRMTTPDGATVMHDDPTDLTNPGPDCYLSDVSTVPVEGTMSLSLRLNFASTDDWIKIGAVGIHVVPIASGVRGADPIIDQSSLTLPQNRPNPFEEATSISYSLEEPGRVEISIYDASGRLVRSLFQGTRSAGEHSVAWDGLDGQGRAVSSGSYYYRVRVGDRVGSKGMVLMR